MKSITRRSFLKGTLLTAAASSLPFPAFAKMRAPNETIRVAVVGFNGRGMDHIGGIEELRKKGEAIQIAALCDVDASVLARGAKTFEDRKMPVETFMDIRKMLEREDIDVVTIATPNHWHSLAAIWAVQNGKDVYVEKPVSHNVWEGRQLVKAARKYNKIVQTGTQSRSAKGIQDAVAWVKAGNLGKIKVARGLCYKPRMSIGKASGVQPIPTTINYDLWCGPAPMKELTRSRLHYDWHWVWDTGCGDLGNQGIHQMDIARWFLGETQLSPKVFSIGGRLGYQDDGETPNTQFVFHDYAKAPLIFEVRGLPENKSYQADKKAWSDHMDAYKGGKVAVVIECEGGHLLVGSDYGNVKAFDTSGQEIKKFSGSTSHYANFVQAVRSRNPADLNAEILEGHLSSALCHTGNISYRLGKQEKPEVMRDKLKGNSAALETLGRMTAHLEANGVDCNVDKLTIGEFLKMDPEKESFIKHKKADALLTRHYRRPFVVPDPV